MGFILFLYGSLEGGLLLLFVSVSAVLTPTTYSNRGASKKGDDFSYSSVLGSLKRIGLIFCIDPRSVV